MVDITPNTTSFDLEAGPISESQKNALEAKIWAEGTDEQVESLGGEHSAKGWAQEAVGGSSEWGKITGTLSNQTDLKNALDGKQDTLSTDQLAAINSGITSTLVTQIGTNQSDISTLQSSKQDALPAGTTGNYLQKTADGVQWAAVDALPSQTGQSGKFLTTDGTSASWDTVSGGVPTLTWYTGNTGTTVTIADTSSANLVKIYKNGILLQPTADYSISGTTLTLVTALESTDKITTEVL